MTSKNQIDQILAATLEDQRLSRAERRALREVFAELELDEPNRRNLRNRAFRLAESELGARHSREVLDWLHDVVKALDDVALPTGPARLDQAFFSPGKEPARRIGRFIDEATSQLDVCVFTITDNNISSRLLAAHQRGVKLRVITDDDKARDRGSDVRQLMAAGVAVREDRTDAHMHHKYAIADARLLLTGSYNWTRSAASENEENILVTSSAKLVEPFKDNFEALWQQLA